MIAVAILASMGLMINTLLSRTLGGKTRVEKRDEILHAVRIVMTKMTEDFSQAFLANTMLLGKEGSYVTGMKGTDKQVDFSTLSHFHYQKNARDTDQVTVGYRLQEDESNLSKIMRRETARLSDKIDKEGVEFPVLENVKEFKLTYYDPSKEEWVEDWDTASVSHLKKLPMAIKIELTVVDPDEEDERQSKEYAFSTIAAVDLYQNELNF